MLKPSICFVSLPIYHLLADSGSSRFCGGAELQQLLIARELAERGYPVSFVTLDHGQGQDVQIGPFRVLGAFQPKAGLPLIRFYYPRLSGIVRALRRADADIYYIRGAAFELAPLVVHARQTGKHVLFAGASNTDFDPKARHFRYHRDKVLYWWGVRRTDGIIAQNKHQAACVFKHLGKEAPIIHNALPEGAVEQSQGETVLWVGNIRPEKFPGRIVDLAETFPDQPFVVVGGVADKSQYPFGILASSGTEMCSLPNLEYTGYLPPDLVEDHYAKAKVLVNTSNVEGFPNTFLHAWSRGVPVLTFVDPDDIVKNNKLGWVVTSEDEMKSVLAGILKGEFTVSSERIYEYFRAECMTKGQVDRYESVIAELVTS
jgi:glycosyltransferase involved in cell wall biosynthesis